MWCLVESRLGSCSGWGCSPPGKSGWGTGKLLDRALDDLVIPGTFGPTQQLTASPAFLWWSQSGGLGLWFDGKTGDTLIAQAKQGAHATLVLEAEVTENAPMILPGDSLVSSIRPVFPCYG